MPQRFEIVKISIMEVDADFEDEAIKKCREGRGDTFRERYVRMNRMYW